MIATVDVTGFVKRITDAMCMSADHAATLLPLLDKAVGDVANVTGRIDFDVETCAVELDFDRSNRCTVSLSIYPNGRIGYAALYSDQSVSGAEQFDGTTAPAEIVRIMREFFEAAAQ